MRYHITDNRKIASTIRYLSLMPLDDPLVYSAGQYVAFLVDGEPQYFSIANAPSRDNHLEFYIREIEDEPSTQKLLQQLTAQLYIEVQGPFGDCIYRHDKNRSVILLAGGVGITQSKAIIEQALREHDERYFYLYWSASCREDLFLENNVMKWCQQLRHFKYKIVFTRHVEYSGPNEEEGVAWKSIVRDFPSLASVMLYCSGPWSLTDEALPFFQQHGLLRQYIFSDRFSFML